MAASMGRSNICHFVKCVLSRTSRRKVLGHAQKRLNSATVIHNLEKVSSDYAIETSQRLQPTSLTTSTHRLDIRHYSSSTTDDNTPDHYDTKQDTSTATAGNEQETLINQSAENAIKEQESTSDQGVGKDTEKVIDAGSSEEHFASSSDRVVETDNEKAIEASPSEEYIVSSSDQGVETDIEKVIDASPIEEYVVSSGDQGVETDLEKVIEASSNEEFFDTKSGRVVENEEAIEASSIEEFIDSTSDQGVGTDTEKVIEASSTEECVDSTNDQVVEIDNEEVIVAGLSEEHIETHEIVDLEDAVNTPITSNEEVVLDGFELTEGLHQYTEEEKKLVQFEDIQDDLYLKIDVTVKSVDREVLRSYLKFLQMAALGFQIKFTTKRMPKYRVTKSSILKSVHIYKKHFRQYETRTHYLFCSIHQVTGSTASVFLEYIQRNLPEGMAMKVTKYKIDILPEHLKPKIESVETTQNQEN